MQLTLYVLSDNPKNSVNRVWVWHNGSVRVYYEKTCKFDTQTRQVHPKDWKRNVGSGCVNLSLFRAVTHESAQILTRVVCISKKGACTVLRMFCCWQFFFNAGLTIVIVESERVGLSSGPMLGRGRTVGGVSWILVVVVVAIRRPPIHCITLLVCTISIEEPLGSEWMLSIRHFLIESWKSHEYLFSCELFFSSKALPKCTMFDQENHEYSCPKLTKWSSFLKEELDYFYAIS